MNLDILYTLSVVIILFFAVCIIFYFFCTCHVFPVHRMSSTFFEVLDLLLVPYMVQVYILHMLFSEHIVLLEQTIIGVRESMVKVYIPGILCD